MKLLKPVNPLFVTQKYGAKSSMYRDFHRGLDIRLRGTDKLIKAVQDGTVIFASVGKPWYTNGVKNANYGKGSPFGTHVKIKHFLDGKDVFSMYCHLDSYNVSVGQNIKAGDVIGTGGSTGLSTAPHLHLEIRQGLDASNKTVNPEPLLCDQLQSESELKALAQAEQNLKIDMDIAWKALEKVNKSREALAFQKGVPAKKYIIISE